jgi:hypothetical protein
LQATRDVCPERALARLVISAFFSSPTNKQSNMHHTSDSNCTATRSTSFQWFPTEALSIPVLQCKIKQQMLKYDLATNATRTKVIQSKYLSFSETRRQLLASALLTNLSLSLPLTSLAATVMMASSKLHGED